MILLANISTSLENRKLKSNLAQNLEKFPSCQQLDIAMFSKLFWDIGLKDSAVL